MYEHILDEQREEARKNLNAWRTLARRKSEVFVEYMMRDEHGNRFVNAPHHNRIHQGVRQYPRLIILLPPEFGKSQQLIGLGLHVTGRNTDPQYRDDPPRYRGAFIGNSFTDAAKSLRQCKQYIKESDEFHDIWPLCVPATGAAELWSNEAINVARPPNIRLRDPSIQALGAGGPILGSRLDWAICDDIINFNNTQTPTQREQLLNWFKSTVLTRITAGGFVVMLCNSWHVDDLKATLEKEGWPVLEEPAIDDAGVPLWPGPWPAERVYRQIEELGELEGPRKMLHKVRDTKSMRFTTDMLLVAKTRGRGIELMEQCDPGNGYATYTGVDLGVSRTKRHSSGGRETSETCFFTILIHPSGVRQVIDIDSGRWTAVEIMNRAVEKHRRYKSICIVENNAAQDLFAQLLEHFTSIPVETYTTGADAAHPEFGLEKIGVEMAQGRWIVPSDKLHRAKGEVYKWEQELYDYRPHLHVGDRVRAGMFAWEGARRTEDAVRFVPFKITRR